MGWLLCNLICNINDIFLFFCARCRVQFTTAELVVVVGSLAFPSSVSSAVYVLTCVCQRLECLLEGAVHRRTQLELSAAILCLVSERHVGLCPNSGRQSNHPQSQLQP